MGTEIIDLPKEYWPEKPCVHPEHNPPGFIVIPHGKMLRHTCPGCGKVTVVESTSGWAQDRGAQL